MAEPLRRVFISAAMDREVDDLAREVARAVRVRFDEAAQADVAPPGREGQVEALKENPKVENPYAVAWASYNGDEQKVCLSWPSFREPGVPMFADGEYDALPRAELEDVIRKRGEGWVLLSKKTGKVLGHHKTRGEAEQQEAAIKASQHADRQVVGRYDRYRVEDLAPPSRTQEGWLRVAGRISRVGIQEYEDRNGKVHRELRLPEDVFNARSMGSFSGVPMTNSHPFELLDAASARQYSVGSVSMPRASGDFLESDLLIWDGEAIKYAEAGRVELSCGYSCELEEVPGVHPTYGPYDAIQRKIVGNHVALVDEGRAGPEARIRLDASDRCMVPSPHSGAASAAAKEEPRMPHKLRVDGFEIEMSDANGATIQTAFDKALEKARAEGAALVAIERKRADELEKKTKILRANGVKLIARVDKVKDEFKSYKHDLMTCPECGGSGKVKDDGEAAEMMCGYCDGKGKVSALGEFGGALEDDASPMMSDDDDDDDMDEMDVDELEVEQATEEESKKAHKDARREIRAAKRTKARTDALARARKRLGWRIDRAVKRRAALLAVAHRHLGELPELATMDEAAIKRVVVTKLEPAAKLDGRSDDVVQGMFELLTAKAASEQVTQLDALRSSIAAPAVSRQIVGQSGVSKARQKMLDANASAWKQPGPKTATK